jgi:hypothetical protein
MIVNPQIFLIGKGKSGPGAGHLLITIFRSESRTLTLTVSSSHFTFTRRVSLRPINVDSDDLASFAFGLHFPTKEVLVTHGVFRLLRNALMIFLILTGAGKSKFS